MTANPLHPPSASLAPGLRAIAPLVIALAFVTAGNGLLTTRTSLAIGGASVGAVRLVVTGYPLGFLIGCALVPRVIARSSHGRIFQLATLMTALATLGFLSTGNVWAWAFLRVVNGMAMAAIFTATESWINLESGPGNRGALISFYMIMSTLGVGSGQTMIRLADPQGGVLPVIAAFLCLFGILPFVFSGRLRPARRRGPLVAAEPDAVPGVRALLAAAPIAVIAALQTGMTNMNFAVMAPIYAARLGYDPGTIAAVVTGFSLGGLLAQLPVGWLSDRFDRRLILVAISLSAALLCALVAALGPVPAPVLIGLVFLYGCMTLSIYPLAIAYASSRIEPRYMVGLSSRLLFIYASGSVAAPAVANELMARVEPAALFLFLGSGTLIVALVTAADLALRRRR